MTDLATLTVAEADYLAQCEETISHGLQTFIEVGTALAMIRDNRLYRAEHATFEAYCADRWGFTDRRARQLIDAAAIGRILPVANAGQAAELARVPEPERAEVWRETVERTDGKPTAAAIRETYERTQTPAPMPEPGPEASTSTGPGHSHPLVTGEADAPLAADAAANSSASEAPADFVHGSAGAGADSPQSRAGEAHAGPAPDPVTPGVGGEAGAEFRGSAPVGDLADAMASAIEQAQERAAEKARRDSDLDDPEAIAAQQRQLSSENVAKGLVALHFALDADPLRWLTQTWQPDAYRERDLPRVRDAFTASGLRSIAKNLDTIADHLDSTGGSL